MPTFGTGRKINGIVYDYSSIEISIAGLPYQGVTEINYSDSLEPGSLRGTGALKRGRSRGMYDAEGSFSIYKEDYEPIKRALSALGLGGFMVTPFLITVTYRELGQGNILITDTIEGCRIKKNDSSNSSGNADPSLHKVDLDVFRVGWNGIYGIEDDAAAVVGGLLGG
jgi:hypothetical protein